LRSVPDCFHYDERTAVVCTFIVVSKCVPDGDRGHKSETRSKLCEVPPCARCKTGVGYVGV